jgi:hypothetical protein
LSQHRYLSRKRPIRKQTSFLPFWFFKTFITFTHSNPRHRFWHKTTMKSLFTCCFLLILSLAALGTSPPQIDRTDIVKVDIGYSAIERQNSIEVTYQINAAVSEVTMFTCPATQYALVTVEKATRTILNCDNSLKLWKVDTTSPVYCYSLIPGIKDPLLDKSPFPCWQSMPFRC